MQSPYRTTVTKLSDLKAYVGKELGLSEWMTVTQERIQQFADATEDHQWIHLDKARAKGDSPYGTTIAHGYLILALTSKFARETYHIEGLAMAINYGTDRVRFPNATPAGGEIRGRASLTAFEEIPRGARLKIRMQIELKGADKPACVAELVGLVYTQ